MTLQIPELLFVQGCSQKDLQPVLVPVPVVWLRLNEKMQKMQNCWEYVKIVGLREEVLW